MTMNSAQEFVAKMQSDKAFRNSMSSQTKEETLVELLKDHGFSFQQKDLIKAMAGCMDTMEKCCEEEC